MEPRGLWCPCAPNPALQVGAVLTPRFLKSCPSLVPASRAPGAGTPRGTKAPWLLAPCAQVAPKSSPTSPGLGHQRGQQPPPVRSCSLSSQGREGALPKPPTHPPASNPPAAQASGITPNPKGFASPGVKQLGKLFACCSVFLSFTPRAVIEESGNANDIARCLFYLGIVFI